VVDAKNWTVKRKIALPEINMNNPHNMWVNRDQSVVYQTQWFDTKLTMLKRNNGQLIKNIHVGDTPSHVMTLPSNDDITIAINGENGVALIPAGKFEISKILPTQAAGHTSANRMVIGLVQMESRLLRLISTQVISESMAWMAKFTRELQPVIMRLVLIQSRLA
jgi:hypothetical protein